MRSVAMVHVSVILAISETTALKVGHCDTVLLNHAAILTIIVECHPCITICPMQWRMESCPGHRVVIISASMAVLARVTHASALRGSLETTVSSLVSVNI